MIELAERIAQTAGELGIETAVIGAVALAAHGYVRATADVDLSTYVDPRSQLPALATALEALGLKTRLVMPDSEDPLGGLLVVWRPEDEDEDGDPTEPVEIVNFDNPFRPSASPGEAAVRLAEPMDERSPLRYVRLPELIALKLYAGSRRDEADVYELLVRNPDADLEAVRDACRPFDLEERLDVLIGEAQAS